MQDTWEEGEREFGMFGEVRKQPYSVPCPTVLALTDVGGWGAFRGVA